MALKLNTMKDHEADMAGSIERQKLTLAATRKMRPYLKTAIERVQRICDAFPEAEMRVYSWLDCSHYYVGLHVAEASLHVSIEADVTSLKEGVIPRLLKTLIDREFEAIGTQDQADERYASRTFEFKRRDECNADIHKAGVQTPIVINTKIGVRAKVKDATPESTCHKVQVGVETKQVPVFKIVCDAE